MNFKISKVLVLSSAIFFLSACATKNDVEESVVIPVVNEEKMPTSVETQIPEAVEIDLSSLPVQRVHDGLPEDPNALPEIPEISIGLSSDSLQNSLLGESSVDCAGMEEGTAKTLCNTFSNGSAEIGVQNMSAEEKQLLEIISSGIVEDCDQLDGDFRMECRHSFGFDLDEDPFWMDAPEEMRELMGN